MLISITKEEMVRVRECLQKVKDKISDPSKWTKGASARNMYGGETSAISEMACSWCIAGAINSLILPWREHTEIQYLLKSIVPSKWDGQYWKFNDHPDTTHEEVMAFLQKAIDAVS